MDRISPVLEYINCYLKKLSGREGFVFEDVYFDEMLHTYGVAYFSASIAHKRGLNPEIAYIAGLLHDAGRIISSVMDGSHGSVGAELAREVLEKTDFFDEGEIITICRAISNHSKKESTGGEYDEVLKDADVLERIFCMNDRCEYSKSKRERLEGAAGEFGLQVE